MTDWPGRRAVRPWTPSDDEAVTHWRYCGRWSIYDQKEGNHMAGDDVTPPAKPISALTQSWNARSLWLARRFGFVEAGMHRCVQDEDEVDYTMVTRPVSA